MFVNYIFTVHSSKFKNNHVKKNNNQKILKFQNLRIRTTEQEKHDKLMNETENSETQLTTLTTRSIVQIETPKTDVTRS